MRIYTIETYARFKCFGCTAELVLDPGPIELRCRACIIDGLFHLFLQFRSTCASLRMYSRCMWHFLALLLSYSFIEWRTLALDSVQQESSSDIEYSTNTLARLYATIRNVALPPDTSSEAVIGDEPISRRLVMLLPGKVLSYYDYFPGDEQETNLNNGQDMAIPPRVMENMFQLADVVPGVYPLHGTETGESMSTIYRNILNLMEVKGFSKNIHHHSEKAAQLLKEKVVDPRSPSKVIPLFQLYRRLKDAYVQSRLEMENAINGKRQELSQFRFEHWYQHNFPVLNSKVEGAFMELQMIQRKLYDNYKLKFGVRLTGIDLEEANVELRAASLSSLDRSKTIYPVSFTPPNWYQYLITAQEREK